MFEVLELAGGMLGASRPAAGLVGYIDRCRAGPSRNDDQRIHRRRASARPGWKSRERLGGRERIEQLIVLDDSTRKDARSASEALNDADFVILCLPDDAAREAVGDDRRSTRRA